MTLGETTAAPTSPSPLAAAEQRLADLVRLSPDAILVNRDDRIEFANAAALELFGVSSASELLGHSPLEWFHPDDHEVVRSRVRRLLQGEPSVPRNTVTVVRADGTARRAEGAATAFRDTRGLALQVVLRDVTERERLDAEVRAAHQQRSDILESITDAFYAVDAAWVLTYLNRRAEASWRRPRQAMLGQTLWHLFPEAELSEGAEALRRAMRERTPARFETFSTFLHTWVEIFAYPSAAGGLSVYFRDITERKRAAAQAAESELRARARAAELQAVLDTVPAAVWIAKDDRADLVEGNRFGEALLRLAPGANLSTTAPPGARAATFRLMRDGVEIPPDERPIQAAARRGQAVRDYELDVVFDDGATRRILGNATPLLDAAGRRHGAIGAFIDVTELRQFEGWLRHLAEALPQLVWTADADGHLGFFNQRWRDYTGQRPGEERWEEALHPVDREGVLARWRAAVEQRTDFELEHRLLGADGQFRWFLRRAYCDQSSRSQRWFGTCTDIHDLKVSQESLRQADRLKEDFLNMASHEFRTPLTALRLQVELLRRNLRQPEPSRERSDRQLKGVEAQVDRLQVLLGTLLDVSRLSAGKFTLESAPLDLADLAAEVVQRFRPEAEGSGTPLRLQADSTPGHWDRPRLDQVLTNLIGNALKYGNRHPVEVEVRAAGQDAVMLVRDRGLGIAPEHLGRIFDRFERAPNTGAIQGLGLGLWIARSLVEAHGGRLSVESKVGEGSTFTVTLPRGIP